MHPATRILIALLSALALPGLSFFYLAVLSLPLWLASLISPQRLFGLLRRSRWLLLGIVLVYAFQLPGPALLDAWAWGPSQPGVVAGAVQAWRLATMLLLIDLLVLRLPAVTLLSGLFALLSPLNGLGLPAERLAVRLGLTLHALAQPARRGLPSFSLAAVAASASDLPANLTVQRYRWRARDSVSLLAVLIGVVWLWHA